MRTLFLAVFLLGCGDDVCKVSEDCDDGQFCNGAETCDPDAFNADEFGCSDAPLSSTPCPAGVACREDTDSCG